MVDLKRGIIKMVHCILGTHVHFNGTLRPSIHCLASAHRKSGYFGMEIIWRFCVKMGWLKIGALYWVCFILALCIKDVFCFGCYNNKKSEDAI